MKTIVVYQSKYGYTQTYAQWIQQALGCQMARGTDCAPADLVQYDTIIYGGGLYAVGINGIRLLTDSFEALQGKNLGHGLLPGAPGGTGAGVGAQFYCGAAPADQNILSAGRL